jgi:hypothetical protein
VFKHLDDDLALTDKETLQHLVSDGGTVSPQDIADEADRHQDTVYAALGRMNRLVEHQYGEVSLKSTYVSELVADALEKADAAIGKAYKASAKAKQAAERGLDKTTEKFIAEECWRKLNRALGNQLFENLDKLQDAALSALDDLEPPQLSTYLCP